MQSFIMAAEGGIIPFIMEAAAIALGAPAVAGFGLGTAAGYFANADKKGKRR